MNTQNAVNYHYEAFPPRNLRLDQVLRSLLKATDALATYCYYADRYSRLQPSINNIPTTPPPISLL